VTNGIRTATANDIRFDINSRGISYTGTNGTGTANIVGFKWESPNLYGRIDNVVECIIGTVSDRRLKRDIEGMPSLDAMDLLERVPVHTFIPESLSGEPVREIRRPGLIADELKQLLPWAVPPTNNPREYQTVDYWLPPWSYFI
jgi:hypothetical protein